MRPEGPRALRASWALRAAGTCCKLPRPRRQTRWSTAKPAEHRKAGGTPLSRGNTAKPLERRREGVDPAIGASVHEGQRGTAPPPHPVAGNVLAFARGLRHLGFRISTGRVALALQALQGVDWGRPEDVRDTLKALFASRHEESALFDTAWEQFCLSLGGWANHPLAGRTLLAEVARQRFMRNRVPQVIWAGADPDPRTEEGGAPADTYPIRATIGGASQAESLRNKDFAALTAWEQQQMDAWASRAEWPLWRLSRRRKPDRRGKELDLPATLRKALNEPEVMRLRRRGRQPVPRPIIILCDISGSMEPYSRMVLRFVSTLNRTGWPLEVFTAGTRLTRITPSLRRTPSAPDLGQIVAGLADYGGGTRLASCFRQLLHQWARRVLRRGAVIAILSDGLDADEPEALAAEMARLRRWSRAILWLNPALGTPGYQPTARGMAAALPYVDGFWPAHTWASLEDAWKKLARLASEPPVQRLVLQGTPASAAGS